jgi:hypothetical protein
VMHGLCHRPFPVGSPQRLPDVIDQPGVVHQ